MLMTNITILVGLFLFCFFETVKDINVLFFNILYCTQSLHLSFILTTQFTSSVISITTHCLFSLLPKYGVALPLAIFQLYNPLNFPVNFP